MEEPTLKPSANEISDEQTVNTKTEEQPDTPRKTSTNFDVEKIPEIQDIYDHIYGNVKNKLVFYENKKKRTVSDELRARSREITPSSEETKSFQFVTKTSSPRTDSDSTIASDDGKKSKITHNDYEAKEWTTELTPPPQEAKIFSFETKSHARSNSTSTTASDDHSNNKNLEHIKTKSETPPNLYLDLSKANNNSDSNSVELSPTLDDVKNFSTELTHALNESNLNTNNHHNGTRTSSEVGSSASSTKLEKCPKCEKHSFVLDRTEILTEINANLKADYEKIKLELKKEIKKTNTLNFEIANIESIFETYYKEASLQKSSFASIYSVMKSYVVDETSGESYTFQRVKAISNYIESLKSKFIHQDRIIKNNFIENPYYSDLMIKHDAILKQLDVLSLENKHLAEEKCKRELDELDAIKELNRQKFQLEKKYQEMEDFYKGKVTECELKIKQMQEEQRKQSKDYDNNLAQKEEEVAKLAQNFTAKIGNYEQELLMIYGKLNKTKVENQA